MAQVGGYVANLREAKDDRVLWLDGGDMWQGTLLSNKFRGEPMVKVMNAIGVDAAALGNHEFDWGREPMLQRASESAFPILSANVVRNDDGLPPDWRNIKPYAVFDVGGVKVGVIGLTTLDTPTYQRAGAFPDLQFRPLAGAVKEWAPRVREAGADVIIVLAHEGGRCDKHDDPDDLSSCEKDSKLFRMVRRLSPTTVDLVIGGHSHRSINHRVGGIAVLQAGAKAKSFGRADLLWDPVKRRVIEVKLHPPTWVRKGARYAGAKVVTPQAAVDALTPYEDQVRALRAAPLGVVAARKMTRDHHAESDLGNLIADALRAAVDGAHVGLQNSGGIRADLRAGPMTYGDLYDVLPFGNQVAVLKVTGKQLMSLLRHGLRRDHGLLQSSGLRLTVDASKVGCRGESPLTEATLADGTAIDPAGVYVIATSDYLAQGGSGWTFLTDSLHPDAVEVREQMMRDATSAHLKALQAASGPVNSAEHPLVDPDRPRVVIKNAGAKRRCSKK
jgi:5'-nucleotidase